MKTIDTELLTAKKCLMYQCHNWFWIITSIIKNLHTHCIEGAVHLLSCASVCWRKKSPPNTVPAQHLQHQGKLTKFILRTTIAHIHAQHTVHSQHKNAAPQNLPFYLFPGYILKLLFHPIFIFSSCILNKHEDPITVPIIFDFPQMIISKMYKCFICYISSFNYSAYAILL